MENLETYKEFMNVKDVMKLIGVERSMAYKVMKTVNEGLENKGKITIAGRVVRKVLYRELGIDNHV